MKQKLLLIVLLLCGIMINAEAASYSGTLSATYTYDASAGFFQSYTIYDIVYACRPANAVSTRYVRTITPNYIKADGSTMTCTDYAHTGGYGYSVYYYVNSSIYYNGQWPGKLYMERVNNNEFTTNHKLGQLNDRTDEEGWGFTFACPRNSYRKYEYSVTIKDNNGDTYTCVVTLSPYATANTLAMKNYSLTATDTSSKIISINNTTNFVSNIGNSSATKTYTLVSKKYFDGTPMSSGSLTSTVLTYDYPGVYTLRVSQPAIWNSSSQIHSKSVDYTFTVNRIVRTMSFTNSNVQSSDTNVRGKNVSELNVLNMTGDGTATYSVKNASNQTVTLTDGKLPDNLPTGTYTVTATAPNTNYYASKSVSYTLEVRIVPELSSVLTVKPNVSLDMTSFIKNYIPEMNPTFTCDDANATISGTTFSSAVEGEYFVNVSTQGAESLESKEAQVRVVVSKHNHGRVNLHLHFDECSSNFDGYYVYTGNDMFICCHQCYYIPEWDFTAAVSVSGEQKNVRFCINDDETVTIVSGIPVTDYNRNYKMCYRTDFYTHTPIGHETPSEYDYNTGVMVLGVDDYNTYNPETNRMDKSSTIPWLEEQNGIKFDDIAEFYNIEGDLTIPEYVTYNGKNYKVTEIGHDSFHYTKSIDDRITAKIGDLKLPPSIETISPHAFDCSLDKEDAMIESVNFSELTNLKRIGGFAFKETNIKTVDLRNSTALQSIGCQAFVDCTYLEEVNMSGLQNFCPFYEQDYGRYFQNNNDWTSVFLSCSKLKKVDLSNMAQLYVIGEGLFTNCSSLTIDGLKLDNTPILEFQHNCFSNCDFNGQVFDCRKLKKIHYEGYNIDRPIRLDGFDAIPLRALISDHELVEMSFLNRYSAPQYIFLLHPHVRLQFQQNYKSANITLFTITEKLFESEDINFGPDKRYDILYNSSNYDFNNNGDNHGPQVFPILRSNTSGVRTMSYFRPLDYKNIKVFDNTHLYNGFKDDEGTEYQLNDFFRTPKNIADNEIEMLIPYTATAYDVENKQVTMTPLSETKPGIAARSGIYYTGKGTTVDAEGNEVLYILTQPEYTGDEAEKVYTNINEATNYLKGGGKDAVSLAGAPHMTETSTQFISKSGTFYYCTGGTLGAYKAYLDLPEKILTAADEGYGSQQKVSALSFVWNDEVDDDDTATAVDAIKDNSPVTKDWFNMQGMKVKTPVSGGIYIRNGRKVLVK